jgi:hypothetical protein
VVTAAFWRTYYHEGKISLAGKGGGARPPPFTTITITSKVTVYAPTEWADTLTLFHLYQYILCVFNNVLVLCAELLVQRVLGPHPGGGHQVHLQL